MSDRIDQLVARADRPTFSFEFFPPKDGEGIARLTRTILALEEIGPDFVSVTYGANGSNRARTLEVTRRVAAQLHGVQVMGHLTCTGQSVDELKQVIDDYAEAGVRNILAIRGDMPGGASVRWEKHPGGLDNATELVELIRSRGDFCVGVGAFPDGHSESTLEQDARILVDKEQAGASFAITQLFFDEGKYFSMVERIRQIGCTMPVVAGIMPVTRVRQLSRFAELSGADIPARVAEELLRAPDDPVSVRQAGSRIAAQLCRDLLEGGAPGLHFFTQNSSLATREILAILRDERQE